MLNNLMAGERPKQGKRKKSKYVIVFKIVFFYSTYFMYYSYFFRDENVDESRILFLPHLQKTIVMIEMLHSKDNFKNA